MERIMRESGAAGDSFVPLTWLCNSDAHILDRLFAQFERMDGSSGLWETDALTNRVQLVYSADGSRVEHCPNVLPPLRALQLTPELLSSLDGLFVNMISGFDVSINLLEEVLATVQNRPFVHIDIHALVLGDLSSGSSTGSIHGVGRTPRGVPDWKRWIEVADSVQMNEFEARWIGDPDVRSEKELLGYIERNADRLRLKHLILTRGAKGASVYDIRNDEVHHVASHPMTPLDTTGAGDVFGSIYMYSMLCGKSSVEALETAVSWATWCTTLSTINEILTAPYIF
jgi:hypothetical protein